MELNLIPNYKEFLPGLVYILLGVCFLLICVLILILHVYKKLREYDLQTIDDTFERKVQELFANQVEQNFRQSRLDEREAELDLWIYNFKLREDALSYQETNFSIKLFALIEIYKNDPTKAAELHNLLTIQRVFTESNLNLNQNLKV